MIHCPHCGSDDCSAAPMLWSSGASQIDTRTRGRTTGIGIAGGVPILGHGHVGIGLAKTNARTTGTQITALAKRFAPPVPEQGNSFGLLLGVLVLGGVGFVLTLVVLGVLAGLIGGVATGQRAAGVIVLFAIAAMIALPAPLVISAGKAGTARAARNAERSQAWLRTWVCLRCGEAGDQDRFLLGDAA